jgi:hypothetical protein
MDPINSRSLAATAWASLSRLQQRGVNAADVAVCRWHHTTRSELLRHVTQDRWDRAGVARLERLFGPPRAVQPAFLRHPVAYRPLPAATGRVDASFLVPDVPNYADQRDFRAGMAAAGEHAVRQLRALRQRGEVTADDIRSVLLEIGMARRELARLANDAEWGRFGLPTPTVEDDGIPCQVDYFFDDPSHRHYAYRARTLDWFNHNHANYRAIVGDRPPFFIPPPVLVVQADGMPERCPLSVASQWPKVGGEPNLVIRHPVGQHAARLNRLACSLFAEVLNDRTLTEEQAMFRCGKSQYLTSQALMFWRGTPSCVETLIDAALRVSHDVMLPAKRAGIEPVLEAAFTPGSKLDLYASQFRQCYA